MRLQTLVRAATAAAILALAVGNAAAREPAESPPDTVCTVLGTADRYVGTTVTVRGVAVSDGKLATLSDAQCKGSLGLSISDRSSLKRDIASFRRTLSDRNARADATVFGRFEATGDAQRPYAIDVYSVRDVDAVRVAEGG